MGGLVQCDILKFYQRHTRDIESNLIVKSMGQYHLSTSARLGQTGKCPLWKRLSERAIFRSVPVNCRQCLYSRKTNDRSQVQERLVLRAHSTPQYQILFCSYHQAVHLFYQNHFEQARARIWKHVSRSSHDRSNLHTTHLGASREIKK